MEISIDTMINILSLLLGGSGGAFFTWRWLRKKAKAEATEAEVSAAKELQDMYQQMIADAKADREDRKAQNQELRTERDHYKQDRDELREKMEKLMHSFIDWRLEADNDRSKMKMDIARLGRKVQIMAPFMCGDLTCKLRQRVTISDEGELDRPTKAEQLAGNADSETYDIEPLEQQDL